jgi:hypothetical protein
MDKQTFYPCVLEVIILNRATLSVSPSPTLTLDRAHSTELAVRLQPRFWVRRCR